MIAACICGHLRMWHRLGSGMCWRIGCNCRGFREAEPLRHHYTTEIPTVKLPPPDGPPPPPPKPTDGDNENG